MNLHDLTAGCDPAMTEGLYRVRRAPTSVLVECVRRLSQLYLIHGFR